MITQINLGGLDFWDWSLDESSKLSAASVPAISRHDVEYEISEIAEYKPATLASVIIWNILSA